MKVIIKSLTDIKNKDTVEELIEKRVLILSKNLPIYIDYIIFDNIPDDYILYNNGNKNIIVFPNSLLKKLVKPGSGFYQFDYYINKILLI